MDLFDINNESFELCYDIPKLKCKKGDMVNKAKFILYQFYTNKRKKSKRNIILN